MNRINYIKLIKAFYDKANEDLGMTPQYLSVYFSLVHINNRTGWKERFNAVYGEVMHFAKLTSKQTYHNALQHLCDNGYITCQKGSNQYTAAVFSIIVLYLDKTSTGKAQVKHKTSTGKAEVKHKTSIGNIPKPINYKTFKPLNFKTNYTTYSLPLIFLKSGGCLQSGQELTFPAFCDEVHHELELVLLLGEKLNPKYWTLGLDLTERKIQKELKQMGQPWELSKSFKGAAALGPWQSLKNIQELNEMEFTLNVNGIQKQHGYASKMIFSFDKLIKYLDERFPIRPGDAIFTGTPAGVGVLKPGDVLDAEAGPLKVQWKVK